MTDLNDATDPKVAELYAHLTSLELVQNQTLALVLANTRPELRERWLASFEAVIAKPIDTSSAKILTSDIGLLTAAMLKQQLQMVRESLDALLGKSDGGG